MSRDCVDTGVVLCRLIVLVQEKARVVDMSEEDKSKLKVKIPLEPIKYHSGAKKGTFHARENTKYFLDWCRGLGIRDDLIFETNGLVNRPWQTISRIIRYQEPMVKGVIEKAETTAVFPSFMDDLQGITGHNER